MSALDDIAPNFSRARDRWPDARNLSAHYDDLSETYTNHGSSLIDLSKTYLESVCITIIFEFKEIELNGNISSYLSEALEVLGVNNRKGSGTFGRIVSGYKKLADVLRVVRDDEGRASHGKDGYIDYVSESCSRSFLLTTDTILAFLLEAEAKEGISPDLFYTREPHGKFTYFNKKVDAFTRITPEVDDFGNLNVNFDIKNLEGFSLNLTASELLFNQDRRAYIDAYEALKDEVIPDDFLRDELLEQDSPDDDCFTEDTIEKVEELTEEQALPPYQGTFAGILEQLHVYINNDLLSDEYSAAKVHDLSKSLLLKMEDLVAVDWHKSNTAIAGVKQAIRHRLRKHIEINDNDDLIENILQWLKNNIADE